ncbi:hypothetical protein JYU34_008463, partial [Plutella xylostella]
MRRPARALPPPHRCPPLYGPLKITSTLLALLVTLLPVSHTTPMTPNLLDPSNNTESINHAVINISKVNTSNIDVVNVSDSREYQAELNWTRRKNVNSDVDLSVVDISNISDTIIYDNELVNNSEVISLKSTLENAVKDATDNGNSVYSLAQSNVQLAETESSIEKLKVDDEDRSKIYFDFSSTINKNTVENEKNIETTTDNSIFADDNALFAELNDTFVNETVSFDDIVLLNDSVQDNHSFKIPSSPITKFGVTPLQTAKPGFMREPPPQSPRTISILGLFELSVGARPRPDGRSELAAARLAVNHVNRRNLLPGYALTLVTNDTKCDPGVGVDRLFHALYAPRAARMLMLLGTACSDVTETIAKIVPYWNIVQVSFGSTSPALSDRSEFPLFCRTVAPDSSHNPARIAFI